MSRFDIGEEVRYDGEVYVVSSISATEPVRYRLLAVGAGGTRFVWALENQLGKMDSYLRSRDDTSSY